MELAAEGRAAVNFGGDIRDKTLSMGLGIMRSIRNVTPSRVQRACQRSRSTSLGLSGCFLLFVTPSLKSENPYYFTLNLLLFSEASIVFGEAPFLCSVVWWFEAWNPSLGWHNQRVQRAPRQGPRVLLQTQPSPPLPPGVTPPEVLRCRTCPFLAASGQQQSAGEAAGVSAIECLGKLVSMELGRLVPSSAIN